MMLEGGILTALVLYQACMRRDINPTSRELTLSRELPLSREVTICGRMLLDDGILNPMVLYQAGMHVKQIKDRVRTTSDHVL